MSKQANPLVNFWNKHDFYDQGIMVSAVVGIVSIFMKWFPMFTGISTDWGKLSLLLCFGVITLMFTGLKEKNKLLLQVGMGSVAFMSILYIYVNAQKAIQELRAAGSELGEFGAGLAAIAGTMVEPQTGVYLALLSTAAIVGFGLYKLKQKHGEQGFQSTLKVLGVALVLFLIIGVALPKGMDAYKDAQQKKLLDRQNAIHAKFNSWLEKVSKGVETTSEDFMPEALGDLKQKVNANAQVPVRFVSSILFKEDDLKIFAMRYGEFDVLNQNDELRSDFIESLKSSVELIAAEDKYDVIYVIAYPGDPRSVEEMKNDIGHVFINTAKVAPENDYSESLSTGSGIFTPNGRNLRDVQRYREGQQEYFKSLVQSS